MVPGSNHLFLSPSAHSSFSSLRRETFSPPLLPHVSWQLLMITIIITICSLFLFPWPNLTSSNYSPFSFSPYRGMANSSSLKPSFPFSGQPAAVIAFTTQGQQPHQALWLLIGCIGVHSFVLYFPSDLSSCWNGVLMTVLLAVSMPSVLFFGDCMC